MKLHSFPAFACFQWLSCATAIFKQRPLFFIFVPILLSIISSIISLLPYAGLLLEGFFYIIITIVIMIAADDLCNNQKTSLGGILKKIAQDKTVLLSLFILGIAFTALLFLVNLILSPENNFRNLEPTNIIDINVYRIFIIYFLQFLLVSLFSIVLIFSPALVYWDKLSPVKASFFNCVALLKNIKPLAIYFFLSLFLFALFALCYTLMIIESTWGLIMFPVLLACSSILEITLYIAYKQIFHGQQEFDIKKNQYIDRIAP